MSHFRAVIVLILLLTSCKGRTISDRDFPPLLAELYKLDRYISTDHKLAVNRDSIRIYEALFRANGYTSDQFIRTIDKHLERPAKLKELYKRAHEILEEEVAELRIVVENETRARSIFNSTRKITSDSTTLHFSSGDVRALRWISSPDRYPDWKFSWDDSTYIKYETPASLNWWLRNIEMGHDKYNYTIRRSRYEKNFSPLSSPLEWSKTYKEWGGGDRFFWDGEESERDEGGGGEYRVLRRDLDSGLHKLPYPFGALPSEREI